VGCKNGKVQKIDRNVADGINLTEYQQIQKNLDFVNLIDYMMVNHYGENSDCDDHNWRAAGGGIADMPWRIFSWDAERVLENVSENRTGQNSSGGPSGLFNNMTNSAEFKMLIADRMHKHLFNDGALMADKTTARWMRRANELVMLSGQRRVCIVFEVAARMISAFGDLLW
jgi:hypothetical protein